MTKGEVLKLRIENKGIGEAAVKDVMRAMPFLPNPTEDDETSQAGSEMEEDPFGSQEALVDLFVRYAKCDTRTRGVVAREEELLLELLARVKKERMQLQYMGSRPAFKHQAGSRNLGYRPEGERPSA